MKRKFRGSIILLTGFCVALFIVYFSVRNRIVEKTVCEKIDTFNQNHQAQISYNRIYLNWVKTLQIDSLLIVTPNDTLLKAASVSANINLLKLISGHVGFRRLVIEDIGINLNDDIIKNYDKLLGSNKTVIHTDSASVNYYTKVETLLKRLFGTIPPKFILKNARLGFQKDTSYIVATIDQMVLKRGRFESVVKISETGLTQGLHFQGKIKQSRRLFELKISSEEANSLINSPIANLFGVDLKYSTVDFSFREESSKGEVSNLIGEIHFSESTIFHPSLSSKPVSFPGSSLNFNVDIGTDYIVLDSISEISLGDLSLHPYVKYTLEPSNTLTVSFKLPPFTAKSFFTSVPQDLFRTLKEIEAEGNLSYRADLFVDFSLPDSLKLNSKITTNNFKITRFNDELRKMNSSFAYTVYEKGIPKRQFIVGTGNPNFTPLSQIPKLLQTCVLFAEDDAFFYSNGFSINAMQRALAEDIKEKRFARGGSTISMQLIKNVYLSREKTFSRKLEEIILVWLIESNRLVSKARMYEVYLNIIEWGPNVYGVAEAARFYFSKDISNLNAAECIFLASVIPSPKKFYYRFDREGNMAQFERDYYVQMSERLAKWGHIPSANADSLIATLNLKGPAKNYLRSSIPLIDTISIEEKMMDLDE